MVQSLEQFNVPKKQEKKVETKISAEKEREIPEKTTKEGFVLDSIGKAALSLDSETFFSAAEEAAARNLEHLSKKLEEQSNWLFVCAREADHQRKVVPLSGQPYAYETQLKEVFDTQTKTFSANLEDISENIKERGELDLYDRRLREVLERYSTLKRSWEDKVTLLKKFKKMPLADSITLHHMIIRANSLEQIVSALEAIKDDVLATNTKGLAIINASDEVVKINDAVNNIIGKSVSVDVATESITDAFGIRDKVRLFIEQEMGAGEYEHRFGDKERF